MIRHEDIFFDQDAAAASAPAVPATPVPARTPEEVAASAARMREKVKAPLGRYGVARRAQTMSELFAAHETAVFEAAAA